MENGAFAPKEQMLHFPYFFQIHNISKVLLWSKGLTLKNLLFHAFAVVCWLFSKLTFSKSSFGNTIRVSKLLDPDQERCSVSPDLGPNCLQRLSADVWSTLAREEVDTHQYNCYMYVYFYVI